MSYHNLLCSPDNIKTITLQGIDCLRANTIIDNLIKEGCTIIPSALFPNEIRITYMSPRIDNAAINDMDTVSIDVADDMDTVSINVADDMDTETNNYNMILVNSGIACWRYIH